MRGGDRNQRHVRVSDYRDQHRFAARRWQPEPGHRRRLYHHDSGSGTTEEYIEECNLTDSPTSSDGGTYPFTFTSTPGPFTGGTLTPATSGTLTVTISPPAVTCIDPASGGTAATWHEGVTSSYTVECEQQSDVSGVTAYPSSIVVATDTIPSDANATLGACTTGTSGSGATEEYIKECAFTGTPSASDAGTYAATFTATGDGGVGSTTSGNLNVTVHAATVSCIDPASGGSSATFVSSAGGTVNAYTVECEEQSGISGVTAYPTSIAIDPSSNFLPTPPSPPPTTAPAHCRRHARTRRPGRGRPRSTSPSAPSPRPR